MNRNDRRSLRLSRSAWLFGLAYLALLLVIAWTSPAERADTLRAELGAIRARPAPPIEPLPIPPALPRAGLAVDKNPFLGMQGRSGP